MACQLSSGWEGPTAIKARPVNASLESVIYKDSISQSTSTISPEEEPDMEMRRSTKTLSPKNLERAGTFGNSNGTLGFFHPSEEHRITEYHPNTTAVGPAKHAETDEHRGGLGILDVEFLGVSNLASEPNYLHWKTGTERFILCPG